MLVYGETISGPFGTFVYSLIILWRGTFVNAKI